VNAYVITESPTWATSVGRRIFDCIYPVSAMRSDNPPMDWCGTVVPGSWGIVDHAPPFDAMSRLAVLKDSYGVIAWSDIF
jgi:hypothetical protein